MEKNKILLVLTRFPYPSIDGTRSKILHNVIEGLAQEFNLEFLIVTIDSYTQDQVDYLEQQYGSVTVFRHSKLAAKFKAGFGLFSAKPLQTAMHTYHDAQAWLSANATKYGGIYLHTVRLAEYAYVSTVNKNSILIDFNDAISLNYKSAKNSTPFPWNIFYAIEEKRVARYEKKLLDHFSNFTVIAEKDHEYLLSKIFKERKGSINFPCIHFGIALKEKINFGNRNSIYFIGNLDYEPNRDAVQFFLHDIWPILHQNLPYLNFYIIGKGKPFEVHAGKERVHATGYLDNITPILSQCMALIVPIRFGAGIPTKSIEAMSREIPVITTTLGALNIQGIVSRKNSIIVDPNDAQEWLKAVQLLAGDSSLLTSIGKNARELVRNQYDLSKSQEEWKILIRNTIKSASAK